MMAPLNFISIIRAVGFAAAARIGGTRVLKSRGTSQQFGTVLGDCVASQSCFRLRAL